MNRPLDGTPSKEGKLSASPAWAVIGIFLILAFGAIALARDFLMPLALGILFFFVFSPTCRLLVRLGLPRSLAAGVITVGILAGLIAGLALVAVPLNQAVDSAPQIFWRLEQKMETLRGSVEEIQQAAEQIDQLSTGEDEPAPIQAETEDEGNILTRIATTTPRLFAQFAFTLVLLYFMLSTGHLLYKRIVQSFSGISDKRQALSAMHEIERSLGSYLGAVTLINACLGVAIGTAMWLWGMPAPVLFGFAAFAFNFVPYVGAVGGVLLATVVALVTMDGVGIPVLVGVTYFALTTAEGQLVTPYFVSRRLRLNTVVVFVAVALWAWLWSVVGMIVAVPLLVVLRVLCSYIPALHSLGEFLSGEDEDAGEGAEEGRRRN